MAHLHSSFRVPSPSFPCLLQSVYEPYGIKFYAPSNLTTDDDEYGSSAPGFLLFSDNQGASSKVCRAAQP